MDTFFLEAIARELGERVSGARIDKIHQPEADLLILRLWNGREEVRLLLGTAPGRAYLTDGCWTNPFTPPRFCQLLRSRLSRIVGVEKVGEERLLRFTCRGREGELYVLAAELMGSRSNLVLIEEQGNIVDALRRNSGGREALPGQKYQPPEVPDRSSLDGPLPHMPAEAASPEAFASWLLQNVVPMSPLVARDVAAAVSTGIPPLEALNDFRRRRLAGEFSFLVGRIAGKPVLSAFPLDHLPLAQREEFSSPSAAAGRFYEGFSSEGEPADRSELQTVIRRSLERLRKRGQKIALDRENLGKAGEGRLLGELLLANLHRVRRGMAEITVENYYSDPPVPVTIPLDSRLTPQENAERLFRGYKKGKKGEEHVSRRLKETEEEILWLEEVAQSLEEAETPGDLLALRREIEDAGLLVPRNEPPSRRLSPNVAESLRRARTPGGWEIIWGKNNRSNDHVSREIAAPEDLWFHAHRLPGCHLVLKRSRQEEVPEVDLLFAAGLAAGYSRGRHDGKVEVMVTEAKWVRKPRGARTGLVTVERYRTVMVKPSRMD